MAEYQKRASQPTGPRQNRSQWIVSVTEDTPREHRRSKHRATPANRFAAPRAIKDQDVKVVEKPKGWGRIAIPSFSISRWLARSRCLQTKLERAEIETLFQRELQDFKTAYIRARY